MEEFNRKAHWEQIFSTKSFEEVSWYQKIPFNSLKFFEENAIPLDAKIVDIGGGDSYLAEFLLKKGYTNLTVVEISENAIQRAKIRIGEEAAKINWIVRDVLQFETETLFDVWHDRAVFHFLTKAKEQEIYVKKAAEFIANDGLVFLGTFSKSGPLKCSGIEIKQYDCQDQKERFAPFFTQKKCYQENHQTPFDTLQHFTFSTFKKTV